MSADEDSIPVELSPGDSSQARRVREARSPDSFATTCWSLVRAAGDGGGSAGRDALESLCRTYWYPLYAFIRRRGHRPDAAQDMTQAFFAYLLEGNLLAAADAQRGRFRFFLLQSLKNFLSTERRRQTAQKRGGGRRMLSLDFESGETRYRLEPADPVTPERLFDRRWALTLLEQSLDELRQEYESTERGELFAALKPHLQGDPESLPFADLGEQLGMSDGAVKVAAHRIRRRYREALRGQIAATVSTPEEVDDELRDLLSALSL